MPRADVGPRGARFVVLASVCIVIAALYLMQDVLIPMALAILLSFLLTPLVDRLEGWGLPRAAAVVVTVLSGFVLVAVLGFAVWVQVGDLARQLPAYQDNIIAKIRALRPGGDSAIEQAAETFQRVQEAVTEGEPPTTATSRPASRPATTQATTQATAEATEGSPGATPVAGAAELSGTPRPGTPGVAAWPAAPDLRPVTGARSPADPDAAAAAEPTGSSEGDGDGTGSVDEDADDDENDAAAAAAVAEPGTTPEAPLYTAPVEVRSSVQILADYLGYLLEPLATAGIVVVFVVFMLIQREDLRDRVIRLVGYGQLQLTTQALDDAASRISRYLVAQAIINGTYGVVVGIGLFLIGEVFAGESFPNFVLWALLCALLRFIPYIGPWIAASFPILVSFAMFDGYSVFLATAAWFVVIELLSNNVMEPLMYGSSTGMSAVAVLASAVFWTFLWGPIGLLLATPLTVCLVVLGKYVPQMRFLNIMLGDEPVLEPPERMYQRLLALDEEEAHELAEEYLDEMPLEQVYDRVLMPALAMAEQDRHRGRLDERRQAFIRRVMREVVDDLADEAAERDAAAAAKAAKTGNAAESAPPLPPPRAKDVAASTPGSAGATGNGHPGAETGNSPRAQLPEGATVTVVCLPAHDEADEVIGVMLARLLARLGYTATPLSVTSLASEMVEAVSQAGAELAVISALPPAAVAHARYLCKRVHARHPKMTIVVGLWTYKGDLKRARDRTTCVGADTLATTLAKAVDDIQQRTHPLLAQRAAK